MKRPCFSLIFLAAALTGTTPVTGATITVGDTHACAIDAAGAAWCWGADYDGALGNGPVDDETMPAPAKVDASALGMRTLTAISAGYAFTCALDDLGDAWCWGRNSDGTLGIGSNNGGADISVPVLMDQVHTLGRRFVQLSAGSGGHVCALDNVGKIWCWGNDDEGEVGNDDPTVDQLAPVQVATQMLPAGRHFIAVSAGSYHTCALDNLGDAWCWGENYYGQTGIGTTSPAVAKPSGVTMPTDVKFTSITAGESNTCAVDTEGGLWCWGAKRYVISATKGGFAFVATPTLVQTESAAGKPRFVSTTLGSGHACGLAGDGRAWCWGYDDYGALGSGEDYEDSEWPVMVVAPGDVAEIEAGNYATCLLRRYAQIACWGDQSEGQIGTGKLSYATAPQVVEGITADAIDAGYNSTCVLEAGGQHRAWCWGSNSYGVLGNGQSKSSALPVEVSRANMPASVYFTQISAGSSLSCALDNLGRPWCWGAEFALGIHGGTTPRQLPMTTLPPGSTFESLSAGGAHVCALSAAGEVWCWGSNSEGQLGDDKLSGSLSPLPVRAALPPGVTAVAVAAGASHSCAITNGTGAVYCWGANDDGQLGQGDTAQHNTPTPLSFADNTQFTSIAAGSRYTCATQNIPGETTRSQLWCWGANEYSQLGDGTVTDALSPIAIMQTDGAGLQAKPEYLTLGSYHTCARSAFFSILGCWGYNGDGRLGNGTTQYASTPEPTVFGPVLAITAGSAHTCAIAPDHSVACTGNRYAGALGDGYFDQYPVPVEIATFVARAEGIFADRFEN